LIVDPNTVLALAVDGQSPPAGPQWVSRLAPLEPQALAYDKPLCASLDGFTLHASTRAGALDPAGREALLRYVLRPPVAATEVPRRSPGRGPPYWMSRVRRLKVLGDENEGAGRGHRAGEEVA
jgi:hypothetical protein